MAKSPELVAAVARILRRDPETVKVAMRRLREAGLIEVTGKGRGGKAMTARDAATLLIGVSGAATLKDAPALAETYWKLPPASGNRHRGTWRRWGPRPLAARYFRKVFAADIGPLDTFGTALTALIARVRDRTLFPEPTAADWIAGPGPSQVDDMPLRLTVRLLGPLPAARIRANFNNQWTFIADYGPALTECEDYTFGRYAEIRELPLAALEHLADSLR
jgi:hypothetical protein